MKTYLVTGGAGFIGSNFIHFILNRYKDYKIINVDKLTYAGNLNNLIDISNSDNYTFIKADICDEDAMEKIFSQYEIDYIVNFAAESHVDRSIKDPQIFVRTNIYGTQVLLNLAKRYWETQNEFKPEKKFIQISTDEVYGSLGSSGYFTENTSINPHSPYSASKASADMLVKAYYDTYKMPVNITRCSNNYGPYQFPEKLIPLVINNCLTRKPIPVYGDGSNIRDWLYVEDHCRAIDAVIHKGKTGEVYNIGGNNEKRNIDIIKTIISILNNILLDDDNRKQYISDKLIRFVEDRKGHDRRYAIDSTKIRNEISWEPVIKFDDGMKQTIEWYLKNQEWLRNITSGEYSIYYDKMYNIK